MKFQLQRDEKVKIWINRSIIVEADSLEEAIKIGQEKYPDDSKVTWSGSSDVMYDTEELIAVQVAEASEDINNAEIIYYDRTTD